MSDTNAPPPSPAPSFSLGRVLLLAVPLALIVWGANTIYSRNVQQQADAEGQRESFLGLLGGRLGASSLGAKFKDADGDLVADAPDDDQCIDPEQIAFSFVASSESEGEEETWKELLAALSDKLGREVTLVSYADTNEQMRALKSGDLHITALGTGEVEGAVNEAGFVPLVCAADQNGDYRYTMKIIVPADSPIEKIDDLRPVSQNGELKKHRVTFVRPRSNSGCTAALVMLMERHNLQPERDYTWGFSYGHETSIEGVAEKRFEAAAVASDILDRMMASGDIAEDAIRTIYESEPFPPFVIGYVYNLKPELREGIREVLLGFEWRGTGVEKRFAPQSAVKFAAVDYKEDWAPVREIRQTGADMLAQMNR